MKKGVRNFCLPVLIILFFLNILAWFAVFELQKFPSLKVIFFDVGQGDAIFIETPTKQQILIDGGPDPTILEKIGKAMPFWDRTIDLIILTHPDRDHLSGLIEVLKRYKIENILWTGVVRETAEYREWRRLIEKETTNIFIAQAPLDIYLTGQAGQNTQRMVLHILYPWENLEGQVVKRSNDTSIVSRLIFKENSFLFTGDISRKVEEKLILSGVQLESDVLKVAHHGSRHSSSEDFLKNVSPELAVIQVGRNHYGHPSEEVLRRLEKFGIKVLRTDKNGDIKIVKPR